MHRTNGDFPLVSAKTHGKGRVFYGSLAHSSRHGTYPDVNRMYLEALQWALGLTDGDPKPHPMRGSIADLPQGRGAPPQ